MKKTLLTKTLLLLFALIAGSTSSWATEYSYTFTAKVWTAAGAQTLNDVSWTMAGTGGTYFGYDGTKGQQFGSGSKPYSALSLSTSGISGTITSVAVNTSGANGISATVAVSVGETAFTCNDNETTDLTSSATNYTFTGSASGDIVISWAQTSSKAIYVKSITVTYSTGSDPDPVSVTDVTVDPTSWTMEIGETKELTATVSPADATTKTVSWTSSNEDVATVAAGVVTAKAAGTATITVTTTDGGFTATCAVTVNAPAPETPASVTLDFTDAGWGFPDSYTTTEGSYTNGGYTIKLGASSNGHKKMTASGATTGIIFGKQDATLSLPAFSFNVEKIKVYGISGASGKVTFNVFVGDEAVSTEVTGAATNHEFAIAADKQAAGTVYVLKLTNDNNCQISKVEIFGYVTTPEVTEAGWASYVTPKALSFAEGEAYVVTAAGSGVVTLTEVTDVPKYTPVLLKGAGAKKATVLEASPASAPANLLAVSDGNEINGYVLANKSEGVGFYKWAGGSLTSGKVYLPASAVAGAPDFLGFDGTTGISTTNFTNDTNYSGEYYNLAGQRVAQPTKGLYIVNGKKVIVK